MKKFFSVRSSYFLAFLMSAGLLGYSIYLQMDGGLQPCPLCVLQRMTLILLGVLFLLGTLFKVKKIGNRIISSITCLLSMLGIAFSGRQVWLQFLPADSTSESCATSLDYMLKVLPFDQVLSKVFQGSVECTQVGWKFLFLSLAEWSLICFGIFFVFSVWQLIRKA